MRHLFAKSAAERGARQLTDAPADIAAVIDEPYDPSPDALLDMYVPGEAALGNRSAGRGADPRRRFRRR